LNNSGQGGHQPAELGLDLLQRPADLLDDLVQRGRRLRVVGATVAGNDLHAGQQVAGVRAKAFLPGRALQFLECRPHRFQYQGWHGFSVSLGS
jgi:hypothetical protein